MKKVLIIFVICIMGISCFLWVSFYNKHSYLEVDNEFQIDNKVKHNNYSFVCNYDSISDFNIDDNFIKYKKVYDYDTYIKFKDLFNLDLKIEDSDFDNNFLIIIVLEKDFDFNIYNKYIINDTLKIELSKNLNTNQNTNGMCSLIDKTLDKEKIQISQSVVGFNMVSYKNISNFEYSSINDCIQDNCLVTDYQNHKTYNSYLIDDFVEKFKNLEEAEIRIFTLKKGDVNVKLYDIKFKDNKFIIGESISKDFLGLNLYYESYEINSCDIKVKELKSDDNYIVEYSQRVYEITDSNRRNLMFEIYE